MCWTRRRLVYANGVRAVGMDQVRELAGLPLKRIYDAYPSKEQLVVATLRRRDVRWRGRLAEYVDSVSGPPEQVLAIFDWLHEWFSEPGFRGCMWVNAHGGLGSTSDVVLAEVRSHKAGFRDQVDAWVSVVDPG